MATAGPHSYRFHPRLASVPLRRGLPAGAAFSLLLAGLAAAEPATASFRSDVMAVLSKAGCNMGVCHGNRNGKGGFKLSLRGQDPELDFQALTAGGPGRRTNPGEPEASLIIRKPTVQVSHEGGRRFEIGSLEHSILRGWIAAGTPPDLEGAPSLVRIEAAPAEKVVIDPESTVRIEVQASFSDGTARDVTRLAVYEAVNTLARVSAEGLVTREGMGESTILVRYLHCQVPVRVAFIPARPGFSWRAPPSRSPIDEHVFSRLRALRLEPSDLASDRVFLRRAFLDLLGLLPAAAEARAFVADQQPGKRERLVDRLLERPEFADFWALKWSDLLRNEEKALDLKGVLNFHRWIRGSIAAKKPLDQFVRELVAARGSTYSQPQANYYRTSREPLAQAESAAQVFLGTRLQCARCHNHPFDRWTQDDYYGWAAFFARVRYKVLENRRRDQNDQHEFLGEQVVWMARSGEIDNPRTHSPAAPRFLGAPTPGFVAGDDRLEALAAWIASADNPLFARVQVNRIWFCLMGRGIVEPIDDFRATNPPSNPALLEALAADFAAHGFDLRHAIRTIMSSSTYQLAAEPNETNQDDESSFSRAVVRRLSAEQILDAQAQVLGAPLEFPGYPRGTRAAQLPGALASVPGGRGRDAASTSAFKFLRLFGKPPRLLSSECERSSETTLGQAFQMISGPAVQDLLTRADNRLGGLLSSGQPDSGIVDELYWTALSRAPGPPEARAAMACLEDGSTAAARREALEDLTWGLVNSKEFLLRE